MITNKEAVAAALYTLISKKDPSVFQSVDIFGQSIVKTAAVSICPETEAIKAGLKERFPWIMQSGGTGTVSRNTAQQLRNLLINKHSITEPTADWAVISWAKALHLKIEGEADQSASNRPVPLPQKLNTRMGITYAVDSAQILKVFDCWYESASNNETSGLTATAQRREPSHGNTSFAELQKNSADLRPKTRVALQHKPASANQVQPATSKTAIATSSTPPPLPKTAPGDTIGMYNQAIKLLGERGKKTAVTMAHSLLKQASSLGCVQAHRTLGELYLKGVGTQTDFNQAAHHLGLAAEKGDAEAQFHLASLYQCGMGVEFDIQKAIYWLKKANDQGHAKAASLMQEILDDINKR